MKVVIDTSIWSLALRRMQKINYPIRNELANLIEEGRVIMFGPIRQELLSGIKEQTQFFKLRDYLRAFPDLLPETSDFEQAAAFFNSCRCQGIQGSNTDFLICAIASRRNFSIFTTDQDFTHYKRILPIKLHNIRC
ncbi:MAG: PIN domain-containing protein [Deltaproteobacteria bacterium]|nr:PIN domain-containing protein [Deltaproteobacteria bacterium]